MNNLTLIYYNNLLLLMAPFASIDILLDHTINSIILIVLIAVG